MISWLYLWSFKEEHKSKQARVGRSGLQTKCKQDHNNTSTFTDIGQRQEEEEEEEEKKKKEA